MRHVRALPSTVAASIISAALCAAQPCFATTVTDSSGDLLSTYIGQVGPDLDILQFTADIQGPNFVFDVLLDGAPGTTALAKYNIGIDRGAGTNTFPPGFAPWASLDAAVQFVPGTGTGQAVLFAGGVPVTSTPLGPSFFTASDNSFSIVVPVSMFPSAGYDPQDYTFMLWSRTQLDAGTPVQLGVADFAPDQGLLSLLPEPSTWAMTLLGFAAIGLAVRQSGRQLKTSDQSALVQLDELGGIQ